MTNNLMNVEVRLARTEDRDAVFAFCEHTWENQPDYIHLVWDKWLADPNGRIFIAVVDGLPVAMKRVVLMSEYEAWWEGLRVDPRYRGRGLVRVLLDPMERYVQDAGILISRNFVSSENTIMNGIMARRGHQNVGSYAAYQASPVYSSVTQLVPLKRDDFELAWAIVSSRHFFDQKRCLYVNRGAKLQELTIQQLSDRLEAGLVWGFKQNNRLLGIAIQSYLEGSTQKLLIGYVNGKTESLATLLYEMRLLAAQAGYRAVSGIFPLGDEMIQALNKADYQRAYSEDYWVYEWSTIQRD